MAHAGVDFNTYDEQGFSALDYAVFSENPDGKIVCGIIEGVLRRTTRQRLEREQPNITTKELDIASDAVVSAHLHQAELRRQYRSLLQENMRPALHAADSDVFWTLRLMYARFLSADTEERRMFGDFCYVMYDDFKAHKRLPVSSAGLTRGFSADIAEHMLGQENVFVIFISYRWIGGDVPDDDSNTQWRRVMNAVERFLEENEDVKHERLALWLVRGSSSSCMWLSSTDLCYRTTLASTRITYRRRSVALMRYPWLLRSAMP